MPFKFCFIQKIKMVLYKKNPMLFILTLSLFLFFGPEESESINAAPVNVLESDSDVVLPNPSVDQADFSSIDKIVKALYDTITFSEGEEPNLDRFRSLFTPNAPFIRITPDGVNTMDTQSFLASFMNRIKTGMLKSFYEAEISRKTLVFGSIAQVFSTYNKGMNTKDPKSMVKGINSIQLYYDGERWWISSILWEDERSDNPIPKKYLR